MALLFILNLLGTGSMSAYHTIQEKDDLESRPEIIEFDKSIIESYQENDDYNYFKNSEENSAWEKFTRWLNLQWNKFIDWLFSGISEGDFWNYLALVLKILLILGLIVLIVWLFNKYYVNSPKKQTEDKSEINLSEDERLIQQKDLPTLIQEAESKENYRLATRFLFLNLLRYLKEHHIIEYQFEKTNADYKSEISKQEIKSDFSRAARLYEFVWYGDFKLEAENYEKAKTRIQALITLIQNIDTHE